MTAGKIVERFVTPETDEKIADCLERVADEHSGCLTEEDAFAIECAISALRTRTPEAATITSLTAEVEKSAWQPIETAPNNKSVILAREGTRLIVTGRRNGPISGWRHCHSSDPVCFEPTHWRHYPEPPQSNLPIRSE
jgi:hypothetical protein